MRWMYVVDNIIWSLQLGDNKDDLKSVLVGEVQNTSAHMADSWGNFSEWSRFQFNFDSANECVNDLPDRDAWPEGIRVDIQACREMGMESRFLDMLEFGSDLLLESMPVFDVTRENYKSALEEVDAVVTMINEQKESGVIQYPSNDALLVSSMGVVTKKLEPGQTGKPKLRVVVDAAESGINDCIRDMPFIMPSINDVVGSAKLGWWAAKFDLKDGFYHIPVQPKLTSLLGIKHPQEGRFATYRYLCFGLKCAPFLFQGTMCQLRAMLLSKGILHDCAVLVYIDDWIIMGATEELVRVNMEYFDKAMTSLGFKLHPTKREGPTQSIEYIGFLLELARARLTVTSDKRLKILAHAQALMEQVKQKEWDLAYADTVVGKLSAVAPVVQGGRAALDPFYQARGCMTQWWSNPQGKTPKGARVRLAGKSSKGQGISETLAQQCQEGLQFWLERLSEEEGALIRLFVFEDGSLAVWGRGVFPRDKPFRVPRPLPGITVIPVVSDAASVGYAFYFGWPWETPSTGSVHLNLWSPSDSVKSSNWRECMTLVYAAKKLESVHKGGNCFVIFISDNQCAVAMATHLHSRSAQIKLIASQLRAALKDAGASSTGFHLPGVLNVHTDRPSRAGEALFAQLRPHARLVQYVKAAVQDIRRVSFKEATGTISFPSLFPDGHLWVIVPAPHDREACIRQALECRSRDRLALALPEADYSDNRWSPIVSRLRRIQPIHQSIPLYATPQVASCALWNHDIRIGCGLTGKWDIWMVA